MLKNTFINFKIQSFLKKRFHRSHWGDVESMMTIWRLDPGLFALIVPFTHCWLTCSNFRYTGWSALYPSSHPERRESFFFCLLGGFLFSVMLSNAYFKMHESTLIWNELFILWFLNILLLQWLQSWSNWRAQLNSKWNQQKSSLPISSPSSTRSFIREGRSHSESTDFFFLSQAFQVLSITCDYT